MVGDGHGKRQVRRAMEDYASFFAPHNFSNITTCGKCCQHGDEVGLDSFSPE